MSARTLPVTPPEHVPAPDPFSDLRFFDGLLLRRMLAYLVDIMVLAGLLVLFWVAGGILFVLSFGLLLPVILLLAGLLQTLYHTLTIGGPASATLGMRLFSVEVRVWNGGKPGYLQALLHTVVFYISVSFTWGLVLLWPLFNNRRRCLHDMLCGTVVIRRL
ncbi:RDD family protein [Ferrovibrio sp.]|uniref:RDD family protein n=1 Tax=Ferrovibrio sp. TaxID=1917215 RepID=UPI00311E7872